MKKVCWFIISLLTIVSMLTFNVSAASNPTTKDKVNKPNKSNTIQRVTIIEDKEKILEYAKAKNIKSPEKIKKIITRRTELAENNKPLQNNNNISSSGYDLIRTDPPITMVGTVPIRQVNISGPTLYTRTYETVVSSSINSNLGLSADFFNFELGLNCTQTYRETEQFQWDVPKGEKWSIRFYPLWTRYYFKITYNGSVVEYSSVDIAVGYDLDIAYY